MALSSAGCSTLPTIAPPEEPTPKNIQDYVTLLQPFSGGGIVKGGDYVVAGYAYVDHHCQKFFNSLEQSRMQNEFVTDTVSQAFTAANAILAFADTTTKTIGFVTQVGTIVNTGLKNYNRIYFFAPYAGSLWYQVQTIQGDYKFKDPIKSLVGQIKDRDLSSVADWATAHQIVQGYARICSLPQFQLLINTALVAKPATGETATGTTKPPGKSSGADKKEGVARRQSRDTGAGGGSVPVYIIR